jgi:hypothetical protein
MIGQAVANSFGTDQQTAADDGSLIQGAWRVVGLEFGGKKAPEDLLNALRVRWIIKGDNDNQTEDANEANVDLPGELAVGVNKLKQLGLALASYTDAHGRLPANAILGKDGKALLSWRVAILPYLDMQFEELYKEFKLDEPWDGPHNKTLLARMPHFFASPSIKPKDPGMTFYQVFVGGAAFDGIEGRKAGENTLSNTVLIVEGGEAVPWTKPQDLMYESGKPLPKLGGAFRTGFHILNGFYNIHFLKKSGFSEELLRGEINSGR